MIVFLIGFMGCGKSYIGRHVAELIGMDYLDMDLEIETRTGKSINQIFEDIGEEGFRTLETKFITSLQANQNIIISTGGGAPCFGNNMELINKKGISIYLNRSKEIAFAQLLKGQAKRPLIKEMTEEELNNFYDKKLNERKIYYEKANFFAGNRDFVAIAKLIKTLQL